MALSRGEATLALHLKAYGIEMEAQHPWCPGRRYRFDFCRPSEKLAVEVDGAVHRIKGRFRADVERHNLAVLMGWRVLRFTPADVENGKAIDALRAALAGDTATAMEVVQRGEARKPRALRRVPAAGVAEVDGARRARGRGKPDDRQDVRRMQVQGPEGGRKGGLKMGDSVKDTVKKLRNDLKERKPNDRSEADRIYAIIITKLEECEALACLHDI